MNVEHLPWKLVKTQWSEFKTPMYSTKGMYVFLSRIRGQEEKDFSGMGVSS